LNTVAAFFEEFEENDLMPLHRGIFRFWINESLKLNGGLPQRESFDPVSHREILPWTLLLDVMPGRSHQQFVFRLFGTGLVERAGRDLTGLTFADAFPDDQQEEYFIAAVKRILVTKQPIRFVGHSLIADRGHIRVNGLLLPFTVGGEDVDIIMSVNLREELRDWNELPD
jgi:hypothetical protein